MKNICYILVLGVCVSVFAPLCTGQIDFQPFIRLEKIFDSIETHDWFLALELTDDFLLRYPSHQQTEIVKTIKALITIELQKDTEPETVHLLAEALRRFPDSMEADIAQLGVAKQEIRSGKTETAIQRFLTLCIRKSSGFIFKEAVLGYARQQIMLDKPIIAMNMLQKLKPSSWESGRIDESKDFLEIMSRLYIQKDRELRKDPQFGLTNVTLKSPLDLSIRHDGWLFVLDEDQRLFSVNPVNSIERQISVLPVPCHRLNTGRLWSNLLVAENQIIENYAPLIFEESSKLNRVVDALWAAPGHYWVLDRRTRSFVLCDETAKVIQRLDKFSVRGREVITLDPDGRIWLLHHASKSVQQLSPNGNSLMQIPFSGQNYKIKNPVDITFDTLGHLYVLDLSGKQIIVFTGSGKYVRAFSLQQPEIELRSPSSLAVGHDGSIFIADRRESIVNRYH